MDAGIKKNDYEDTPYRISGVTDYGRYWSVGFNGSYFLNDYFSLMSGLSVDYNSYEVKYGPYPPSNQWEKYELEYYRLVIPAGIHFHYGFFMVGGGLYFGTIISSKVTETDDSGYKNTEHLGSKAALGYFIDLGLNFKITDTNNLSIFLRLKDDVTPSYKNNDTYITSIRNESISINVSYGFQMN